jgi:hypothetical protein
VSVCVCVCVVFFCGGGGGFFVDGREVEVLHCLGEQVEGGGSGGGEG